MNQKKIVVLSFVLIFLSGCSRIQSQLSVSSPTPNFEIQSGDDSKLSGSTVALQTPGTGERTEKGGLPTARQISFSSEADAQKLVGIGPTVYFFKASWCPTCQAAQRDLDKNIGNLPAGTSIVTVDYDNSSDLKRKYGITYQHTFVQIDQNGLEITKWQGGGVEEISKNIRI